MHAFNIIEGLGSEACFGWSLDLLPAAWFRMLIYLYVPPMFPHLPLK